MLALAIVAKCGKKPLAACLAMVCMAGSIFGAELDHPLFRAIRERDEGRVARLLRQGTPANLRAADGTTPLMAAALHGSAESVRKLLERGADPNAANNRGVTALLWSVTDQEKTRLLVEHGANVDARSALGNTPLLVAASVSGGVSVVDHLLAHGAELTARNGQDESALLNAVEAADLETIDLLLAHAERTEQLEKLIGNDSTLLLETAAARGTLEIVTLFCDRLTAANDGEFPDTGLAVNQAFLAQKPDIARELIERGGSVAQRTPPGNEPAILLAAYTETGDTSALKALLQRDVETGARNKYEETALTWARRRGHPELIETLVAAGIPEHPDETPEIPRRSVNLHAGNQQRLLVESVGKGIALLQDSSDVFLEERKTCVSCHHQNLPAVAIGWARDRGLPIDEASLGRLIRRQTGQRGGTTFLNRCYQLDEPAPVPPRFFGYALWGLSALGHAATETIQATVWYLAATQKPNGSWTSGVLRPPMGDGDFTATVLAMQALQLYPIAGRTGEFRQRIERAARWLDETPARYHQERVYQLLGLGWAGRSEAELTELVDRLLEDQRGDGGWSQLPHLESDAWATGQTLVALHVAGGMPTSAPAYQRGLKFLLNTQFDDGSWFVKSRSWPFQPPFESGFPHGRDQWVSAPATAWAIIAMTLAIEPQDTILPKTTGEIPANEPKSKDAGVAEQAAPPPVAEPVEAGPVDFVRHIQPLLERSCVGCHAGDEPQGNLDMTTRMPLLRGGETGVPAVVPGLSGESLMYIAVSGASDELHMPPLDAREKFPALTAEEVAKIKQWIDTGASWPKHLILKTAGYE